MSSLCIGGVPPEAARVAAAAHADHQDEPMDPRAGTWLAISSLCADCGGCLVGFGLAHGQLEDTNINPLSIKSLTHHINKITSINFPVNRTRPSFGTRARPPSPPSSWAPSKSPRYHLGIHMCVGVIGYGCVLYIHTIDRPTNDDLLYLLYPPPPPQKIKKHQPHRSRPPGSSRAGSGSGSWWAT